MDSMLQTMLQCSTDQADALVSAYRDEHGWHAETVIGAAGALVGYAIQASAYSMAAQGTGTVTEFERQTSPPFGKFVNCGERLDIFAKNEFAFMLTLAEQLGWFAPKDVPDLQAIVAACIDQIGGEWFPRLSVDPAHMPREWSPDAVPRFARQMRASLETYSLPHNVCEALCLTLALGHLVAESTDRLDPAIGLRIGLEMAVATSNIGNLDRPHVASHDDDEVNDGAVTALRETPASYDEEGLEDWAMLAAIDYDATLGEDSPLSSDVKSADESVQEDVDDIDGAFSAEIDETADDEDMPVSRASRLSRSRPKHAAFGKRQFG